MSWLTIVFWFVTHLPDILSLIRAILHGGSSGTLKEQARLAISSAIQSGDTQKVKDVVEKCHSSMCAPDLVDND